MALTEEQIKNLKKGDPIVIRTLFDHVDGDGDIKFRTPSRIGGSNIAYISPDCVSLPSELGPKILASKYAPYRLFKEGDRVKPRIVYGRTPMFGIDGVAVAMSSGDFIIVTDEGERPNGTVDVKDSDGTIMTVDPVYLELITPVEEMEPYSVQETMSHDGWQIVRDGLPLVIYDARRHPNAKAAAEAERDRLNAEWRKDMNND